MNKLANIKIYGAQRCHKSKYYIDYFKNQNIDFEFFDVEENEIFANELRDLYENRKLNFPTILIDSKKLRNPKVAEIEKWIDKLKENETQHK